MKKVFNKKPLMNLRRTTITKQNNFSPEKKYKQKQK